MSIKLTQGQYTLNREGVMSRYARNAIPGSFPRRFVEVEYTAEDKPTPEYVPQIWKDRNVLYYCSECGKPVRMQNRDYQKLVKPTICGFCKWGLDENGRKKEA